MKHGIAHLTRGLALGCSLSLGTIYTIAAPQTQSAALREEVQQLQAQYEARLAGLQAGHFKALPIVDERSKAALQQTRQSVTENTIKNGGVCGRRALFRRFILRSCIIPTIPRPQSGHAALARWTPNGWVINLGTGWGNPDASRVMGMTDTAFVVETLKYERALRAQWADDALGERKYLSLKPSTGGLWNILSVLEKKGIAAEAKPAPLAALGDNLGEANGSAETRDRAFVKATVSEAERKIVIASNGVITIPAAACDGAQIVASFLGGHQLFSGGGTINCEVELPRASICALTAHVSTVQDNPKLLLTTNDAKRPIEITAPYTISKWEQTPSVQVALVNGKNSLRFKRSEGSRGLTIKDFTLTPVK